MHKYVIYGLAITLFTISGFTLYQCNKNKAHATTVALIQPVSHPALDEIVQSFLFTLSNQKSPIQIDRYNGSGNRMLLQSTINNLLESNVECLVTVGTDATTIAVQYAIEHQLTKPICFVAAEPSEALRAYPYLTGVRSDFDADAYCRAYQTLFSERKKIVLPYDPAIKAGVNEQDALACKDALQKHGHTVTLVPIDKPSSLYERTLNGIEMYKPDTIMILMDNTVVSGIDSLIQLCSEYQILLYAADHNSTLKGAGVSYGHDEALFGSTAASIVIEILNTHHIPNQQKIQQCFLLLNKNHLRAQGVMLSEKQESLIQNFDGAII